MGLLEGRPPSRQMLPNMATNALFLILNTLIGLMIIPYYESRLGIAAYGIIPLATSVTSYMILISNSFSTAVSRYMAVSVEKNDPESFNRTYSTTSFGILRIILFILPIGMFVALVSPLLFNTGSSPDLDVQVLFAGVILSALITSWGLRYHNVFRAENRIDLENAMKILQLLVQTVLIVTIFYLDGPSLWTIGVAYLAGSLAFLTAGHLLVRRVRPDIRYDRRGYDNRHFMEICGVSGWTLVESIGSLLMLQTSMVLTNVFLGPESNGELGFIASIVFTMAAVSGILSSTFTPLIIYSYSGGRTEEMVANIRSAIKVIGIFIALPLAFVCVFSPQILTVWVGARYSHLGGPLWVMLFLYAAFCATGPIDAAGVAYLKVRAMGLSYLVCGILNVLFVTVILNTSDLGLMGVAVSWTVFMFIQKLVFMPLYYGRVTGVGNTGYIGSLLYSVLCFAIVAAMCAAMNAVYPMPSSVIPLAVAAALVSFLYLAIFPNILLDRREKDMVRNCLPGSVRSLLPRWFL